MVPAIQGITITFAIRPLESEMKAQRSSFQTLSNLELDIMYAAFPYRLNVNE